MSVRIYVYPYLWINWTDFDRTGLILLVLLIAENYNFFFKFEFLLFLFLYFFFIEIFRFLIFFHFFFLESIQILLMQLNKILFKLKKKWWSYSLLVIDKNVKKGYRN